MNKYYVATPFVRSKAEKEASFVEALTGREACRMVLGGYWRIKKPENISLENMAIVYKVKSFDLIDGKKIDSISMRYYERS